jgi:hypothetical protein
VLDAAADATLADAALEEVAVAAPASSAQGR